MHVPGRKIAIPWLGSKYNKCAEILPLLANKKAYVEVFGGGGVILLNKTPSQIETYNDLNSGIVNFFRQLRDNPEPLITSLVLTPHSREEYEKAWEIHPEDTDTETARKFFVRIRQSFLATGGQKEKKGWMTSTRESRVKISEATNKYLASVENLWDVVNRFRTVQIENRSWEWILEAYDTEDTLFYQDPPYDDEDRSESQSYIHDFVEDDHRRLAEVNHKVKAAVAISGYNTELMNELYGDWIKHELKSHIGGFSTKRKQECVWTNYQPQTTLKLF